MAPLLAAHRLEIANLCTRYGVQRADVFGSAASGSFTTTSDVDFLVEFQDAPMAGLTLLDRYLGLKDSLEALLHHSVDIVMPGGITNPYFREAVNEHRERVYGA